MAALVASISLRALAASRSFCCLGPPALMILVCSLSAFSYSGCHREKDCPGSRSSVVFALALIVFCLGSWSGRFSRISWRICSDPF